MRTLLFIAIVTVITTISLTIVIVIMILLQMDAVALHGAHVAFGFPAFQPAQLNMDVATCRHSSYYQLSQSDPLSRTHFLQKKKHM